MVLTPGSRAYSGFYDPERGTIVGMDIGSETSRVGIMRDGKFEALYHMPSCVAFTEQGILVGEEAKTQRPDNPSRTICDVRMLLGQRWSDPRFQKTIEGLHYRVVQGGGDRPVVKVDIQGREHTFTPEEIVGNVMAKLRDTAAAKIGEDVGSAVVAVPADFNPLQSMAVEDAGATIGLDVVRRIKEYVAAIIAYGLDTEYDDDIVIVLELGASKTEVTLAYIDQGVMESKRTVSEPTSGREYNRRLVNYIVSQCATEGVLLDQRAQIEVEESMEFVQKNRSFGPSAYCLRTDYLGHCPGLPKYTMKDSPRYPADISLSATVLEPLKDVLRGFNKLSIEWEENTSFLKEDMPYIPSNISNTAKVVAVGGFSKSPMVTRLMKALRRHEPTIHMDFEAEEAVLKGAAMQAEVLLTEDAIVGSYMMATPHSIGLETSQGYMQRTIRRHSVFPTRKVQNLTTAYDNQESMLIRVFEGDRMMARDNSFVGELELTGIPRAPRHVPVVEVAFELDSNGIIKVDARCINTTISVSDIFRNTRIYARQEYDDTEQLLFEADQQVEETTPVDKASFERYIGIVERVIARDDVVDEPDTVNDLEKEANRVIRETREWLEIKSSRAPSTESDHQKSNLWDVVRDLLNYNPIRETRKWLDTQSNKVPPPPEFDQYKSKLWDMVHDLLNYNPPGRIYSVGSHQGVDRGHGEL